MYYLVFSRCDESSHAAAKALCGKISTRRHPLANVFRKLAQRVMEPGNNVLNGFVIHGWPRSVRTAKMEDAVLLQ